MQFSEVLSVLMKKKGVTAYRVAKDLKYSKQTIANWLEGKTKPEGAKIEETANYFGVSIDYLMKGDDSNAAVTSFLDNEALPVGNLMPIPVIGTVRAGFGGLAYEENEGYEYANVNNTSDYFYLRVKGDSMEPDIRAGDYALVRKQEDAESGSLCVIIINGDEGAIKRVYKHNGGKTIVLQSFNPKYEPKTISGKELEDFHIAGVVIKTERKW